MEEEIREIELRRISPNLRIICSSEAVAIIESEIRLHGQREPIHIYFEQDTFRIIDGEKRWRACKRIGIRKIKAVIARF